jgi:hypothetical protein
MIDSQKEEAIRDAILRMLYAFYLTASNEWELKRVAHVIYQEMQKHFQYSRQEFTRNLQYLVDEGFVREETVDSTSPHILPYKRYYLSAKAIRIFEGEGTKYKEIFSVPNVNITNGNGVVAIGNNITVQQSYTEVASILEELMLGVFQSKELNDAQKSDIEAEIKTIQLQLAKKRPNKVIISAAMQTIQAVVTAEGLLQFIDRIHKILVSFGLM